MKTFKSHSLIAAANLCLALAVWISLIAAQATPSAEDLSIGQKSDEHSSAGNKKEDCHAPHGSFSFAVLGDTAYRPDSEMELKELIDDTLNKEKPCFVVHVGDFQGDPRGLAAFPDTLVATTEEELTRPRDILFSMNKPFLLTPGDNDWADTILAPVGNPDPLGTLAAVRRLFYSTTNVRFPFEVVSQPEEFPQFAEYVENRRWIIQRIVFVTVHTIGPDNGLTSPSQAIREEAARRIAANLAWLEEAFSVAAHRKARGVVILTQAAFDFRNPPPGFKDMIDLIKRQAKEFGNELQILYVYGDQHRFLVDKPLPGDAIVFPPPAAPRFKQLENFTAIQVPGPPLANATGATGRVRITVNLKDPDLFHLYLSTRNERQK